MSQELIDEYDHESGYDDFEWRLYGCRLLQQLESETCEQAMALYREGYAQAKPGEDAHARGLDQAAPFALNAGFDRETVEVWVLEARRGRHVDCPG